MRYAFYYLHDGYTYRKKILTRNHPLNNLFHFLEDQEHGSWVRLSEDENDRNQVMIYSDDDIKRPIDRRHFAVAEEFWAYADRYHKYSRKRLAEMPAIRITQQNYEQLEQQWQGIYKRKPHYVIFREHDSGYVDILETDDITTEDLANMKREAKIRENYFKRWTKYRTANPEKFHPIWRSPADNFFESDFALYDPADEQGLIDEKEPNRWMEYLKQLFKKIF